MKSEVGGLDRKPEQLPTPRRPRGKAWLPALVAAAVVQLSGCAGGPGGGQRPLPYKVAVIPFGIGRMRSGPVDQKTGAGNNNPPKLRLDPALAERTLVRRLSGARFAKVEVLPPCDAATAAGTSTLPREERDQRMIKAAAEAGANLIMECDLKVADGVESWLNEKFWLNLPLFLIGGPMAYFVGDRSYRAQARLQVAIHLLDPLVDGRATLSDGRALVLREYAGFEEVSLAYLDRTATNPLWWLATLVVPCGFLEVDNDRVRRRLEEEIAGGLMAQLDLRLEEARSRLVQADPVSDFYLDPEVRIGWEGTELVVSGEAVLRVGSVRRLDGYTVSCGGHEVRDEFAEARIDADLSTVREEYHRYPFKARLPLLAPARFLEVEVRSGGRDRHRRTFCVPVPLRPSLKRTPPMTSASRLGPPPRGLHPLSAS